MVLVEDDVVGFVVEPLETVAVPVEDVVETVTVGLVLLEDEADTLEAEVEESVMEEVEDKLDGKAEFEAEVEAEVEVDVELEDNVDAIEEELVVVVRTPNLYMLSRLGPPQYSVSFPIAVTVSMPRIDRESQTYRCKSFRSRYSE